MSTAFTFPRPDIAGEAQRLKAIMDEQGNVKTSPVGKVQGLPEIIAEMGATAKRSSARSLRPRQA